MNRVALTDIIIDDTRIDKLELFLDDEGKIIFLPMLWTLHLSNTQSVYRWHTEGTFYSSRIKRKAKSIKKTFEAKMVSDNTIENYIGHFFNLLRYINNPQHHNVTLSVHNTHLITSKFLNEYLNGYLPEHLQSYKSLTAHQAAISSYFNFLQEFNIKGELLTNINRKTRQYMAEKDTRTKKINYISRVDRNLLLQASRSKRDKLIMRMGYEIGLRSEENTGLVLGKHKAKGKINSGLLVLFYEIESKSQKQSFEYVLNGKYTKGGRTRKIYFDRELLTAMKNYYETERQKIMKESGRSCNTLFVRVDNAGKGLPISKGQASTSFRNLKKKLTHLDQVLSYHDLRHSFATELYHDELFDDEGRETRSESAALLVVGERLGHKTSSRTTKAYIRLREQMLTIEEIR